MNFVEKFPENICFLSSTLHNNQERKGNSGRFINVRLIDILEWHIINENRLYKKSLRLFK